MDIRRLALARSTLTRSTLTCLAAASGLALLLLAASAPAETEIYRATPDDGTTMAPIGLRLGYTSWESLEQIHFGAHMLLGEVLENVDFTPNVELGFGDDLTVMALNGDFTYRFTEFVAAPWGAYGGGSLALIYVDADPGGGNTDLGLSAVGGLTRVFDNGHEGRIELRLGVLDSPGFKLTCGYTLF